MKFLTSQYMKLKDEDTILIGGESLPVSICDDKDCFLPLIFMHILHLEYNLGTKKKSPCLEANFVATDGSDSLLGIKVEEYNILDMGAFNSGLCAAAESHFFLFDQVCIVSDPIMTIINEINGFVKNNYKPGEVIDSTKIIAHILSPIELINEEYCEVNKVLKRIPYVEPKEQDNFHFELSKSKTTLLINDGDYINNCLKDTKKLVQHSDSVLLEFLKQISLVTVSQSLIANKLKDITSSPCKSDLIEVDESILLAALLGSSSLLPAISESFNTYSHLLTFQESHCQLRKEIFKVFENRTYEISSDGSKSWFDYADKYVKYLSFSYEVEHFFKSILGAESGKLFLTLSVMGEVLKNSRSTVLSSFYDDNKDSDHTNNRLPLLLKVKKVKQNILQNIVGQHTAVEQSVSGLRTSVMTKSNTIKGLFTFFGESGTGKTLLAKQLADQFEREFNNGYKTILFNMEGYSDERDAMKLFGCGQQFSNSLLGQLTSEVSIYPRQFIVFDEIEKANSIVLQSLLTLIDTGFAKDYTTNKLVDFSQCYIIFTSNLGQKAILESSKSKAKLNPFDLLKNDKGFSPEFISRLSKGNYATFKKLSAKALLKITSNAINQAQQDKNNLIEWPMKSEQTLINTISYEVSPRVVNVQVNKLNSDIIEKIDPLLHTINNEQINNIVLLPSVLDSQQSELIIFTNKKHSIANGNVNINFATGDIKWFINQVNNGDFCAVILDESYIESLGYSSTTQVCTEFINRGNTDSNTLFISVRSDKSACFTKVINPSEYIDYQFIVNNLSKGNVSNVIEDVHQLCSAVKDIEFVNQQPQLSTYNIDVEFSKRKIVVQLNNFVQSPSFNPEDISLPFVTLAEIPNVDTRDVIGLTDAKERLLKVSQWLKNDSYLKKHNINIPKGYLLAGEQGTGKTFLAKAIAGECGLPFFNVNAADLTIGDVDKNIKYLFNMLEKYQPAILFIDEIDSIATIRNQSPLQSNRTVNSLLTALDGFNTNANKLFVIAATNFPELIDPALKRSGRLEETLICDLPNKSERNEIVSRLINKHQVNLAIAEIKELVTITKGASVAFIEKLFRESFYQKKVDVAWHFTDIKYAFNSLVLGNENNTYQTSDEQVLKTAYHEVGHLITQKLLFPEESVRLITIQPRRNSLGSVSITADENQSNLSRDELKKRLQVLLAGRAAEVLMLGEDVADTGAMSDINKATIMAKQAISLGGLSKSLGMIDYSVFKCAEQTVLLEVQAWLSKAFDDVTILLKQNKGLINRIKNILIVEESLDKLAIDNLFSKQNDVKGVTL